MAERSRRGGAGIKIQRTVDHKTDRSLHHRGARGAEDEEVEDTLLASPDTEGPQYRGALLTGSFLVRSGGSCDVEDGSAYGAALLAPQVARSAGWPIYLTGLALRSWIFLFLSLGLQYTILMLVATSEDLLGPIAGQMNLCNFGNEARGPAGSIVTPARTYPWGQYITRVFVRDSLKSLFPDQAEDIESSIDPGEYALESKHARIVCCFIFIIATLGEFLLIMNMAKLLYYVPTEAQSWIGKPDGASDEGHEHDGEGGWIDKVKVQVAGMSLRWKLINGAFILFPKTILWFLCCRVGINFLMETSTIADVIVNAVAMTFILNIDEMICNTFMHDSTRLLLHHCEEYPLFDVHQEATMRDKDIYDEFYVKEQWAHFRLGHLSELIPARLMGAFLVTGFFVLDYYWRRCTISDAGEVVSKPMHVPQIVRENLLQIFFPSLIPTSEETFWEMPSSQR